MMVASTGSGRQLYGQAVPSQQGVMLPGNIPINSYPAPSFNFTFPPGFGNTQIGGGASYMWNPAYINQGWNIGPYQPYNTSPGISGGTSGSGTIPGTIGSGTSFMPVYGAPWTGGYGGYGGGNPGGVGGGGSGGSGVNPQQEQYQKYVMDFIDSIQKASDEANANNVARYEDALRTGRDLLDRSLGNAGLLRSDTQSALDAMHGRIMGNLSNMQNNVLTGYQNRMDRNLGRLEGFGTQAEKDLREKFAQESAVARQNNLARGLTGTTLKNELDAEWTESEEDAVSRMKERIQQYLVDTDSRLSGEGLAAQQALGGMMAGMDSSLSGMGLQAMLGLGQDYLNRDERLTRNIIDDTLARTDIFDPNFPMSILQLAGAGGVGTGYAPFLQPGIPGGGGYVGGNPVFQNPGYWLPNPGMGYTPPNTQRPRRPRNTGSGTVSPPPVDNSSENPGWIPNPNPGTGGTNPPYTPTYPPPDGGTNAPYDPFPQQRQDMIDLVLNQGGDIRPYLGNLGGWAMPPELQLEPGIAAMLNAASPPGTMPLPGLPMSRAQASDPGQSTLDINAGGGGRGVTRQPDGTRSNPGGTPVSGPAEPEPLTPNGWTWASGGLFNVNDSREPMRIPGVWTWDDYQRTNPNRNQGQQRSQGEFQIDPLEPDPYRRNGQWDYQGPPLPPVGGYQGMPSDAWARSGNPYEDYMRGLDPYPFGGGAETPEQSAQRQHFLDYMNGLVQNPLMDQPDNRQVTNPWPDLPDPSGGLPPVGPMWTEERQRLLDAIYGIRAFPYGG